MIVTFEGYRPTPKLDGLPWLTVTIFEGPTQNGPWNEITDLSLDPVDTDPTDPIERSFETNAATLEAGWYLVQLSDAAGNTLTFDPVHNVDFLPIYTPTVQDVANFLRARTVESTAGEAGTFTEDTRPTADQVARLIEMAARDVHMEVGDIPAEIAGIEEVSLSAKNLIALRAAMYVELNYFPEQVANGRSPYDRYKDLWDEGKLALERAVEDVEAEAGVEDTTGDSMMPAFNFEQDPKIVGWGTIW